MTQEHDHPITPPIELLRRLREEATKCPDQGVITLEEWVAREVARQEWIATQAARWGADQELEACCKSLRKIWQMDHVSTVDDFLRELRAARRPKPPSLKEQALAVLEDASNRLDAAHENIIRRALEALPDEP